MTADAPRDFTPLAVRLAAIWVAAGALFKLFAGSPNDLPPVLHDLPLSIDLFFKLAIGIELTLVCLAFLKPKLAWLPMAGMFVVFEIILAISLSGGEESCGCFGSSITIPPEVMMAIDSVLLIALLITKPWASTAKGTGPMLVVPVAALVCLALPFLIIKSGTLQAAEEGDAPVDISEIRYVMLPVEEWKDQLIYDTDFAALFPNEIETLPTDGLYIFWRWDCDHCAQHLQELADQDDMSKPIVLVRLMQESDNDDNQAVLAKPVGSHVIELSLPAGPQYVLETPADFILEGGMIVGAREGIKVDEH